MSYALPAGNELRGYRVERVLEDNSFGIVYLAWHKGLNTRTVIKEFMPIYVTREGGNTVRPRGDNERYLFEMGLSRFLDAARLLYSFRHPNVVKVTDVFEANSTGYFVMPYLGGCTLYELLKSQSRPGKEQLLNIFIPLLEGLKYIHGKGQLHREITPKNIHILSNGHPVLMDFVNARLASRNFLRLNNSDDFLYFRHAPYKAFEEYSNAGSRSPATDMYRLGACMYHAITGELPHETPARIEEDKQPRLADSDFAELYGRDFLAAVDTSLAVWPKDRFQNGLEFQQTLLAEDDEKPLYNAVTVEKTYTNSIGMEFVLIPSGSFMMGSKEGYDDERPQHRVTISRPFYLGKYEVTQEQWVAVMGNNPSEFEGRSNPVEQVSWLDAQEFIKRLNAKEGHNRYRLPTEAEWEYAARAWTSSAYSFGDDENELSSYGWYWDNSGETTHPVGQKKPNPWGLYDVHGNVDEWVQDWYGETYYANSLGTTPMGPPDEIFRVVRGGSWNSYAERCRSATRFNYTPGFRDGDLGFRLALSPE